MRIVSLRKLGFVFLLLLSAGFFSCKENTKSVDLLKQAQSLAESNSAHALILLDSIPSPEAMDRDNYMQYIVAHVQTKYKNYKDIAGDTAIFEAQKYFENSNDPNKVALASFYVGAVYLEQQKSDKALEYFFKAKDYAQKAGNNMLTGRSLNNIAILYFDRDMMDRAISYYRQALEYYDKVEGFELDKLLIIHFTGRSYENVGKLDSAHFYADKGLELAIKTGNIKYQATFKHLLGIALREKGKYKEAADYIHSSLAQTTNSGDSLRRYLSLSIVYNDKNQLDSAKYYTNLVKKRLAETTDNYILRDIYGALATNSEQQQNYQESVYYIKLQKDAIQRITEFNGSQKLQNAEKKYRTWLQEKEMESLRMRSYLYILGGLLLLLILAAIFYLRNRNIRHKHLREVEKNKLLNTQNEMLDQKANSMIFLQRIYRNMVNEWGSIDKEVKALAREYDATEKPTVYIRIEQMVEDLKQKTNEQLIEWAKDYLKEQDFSDKITIKLNNKDLLLLVFCCSEYSKNDIAGMMGIPERKVHPLKLSLKHKLLKSRLSESEIEQILFSKDD